MEFLTALWLPIVVSSIALFIASAVAWMFMPHHKGDFRKLENEDQFMKDVREAKISAGRYMFPHMGSHENANDPEMKRKCMEGPLGTLNLFSSMNMGVNMFWTFVYFLIASSCLAYLGWVALEGETLTFIRIFRVTGTAGILAFTLGAIPNDIWFKRPMWTNILDGIVYGIILGAIFAALWPS